MNKFSETMSSMNEEVPPPPPKPKTSPLEFRNTDLVSRLLAATPPYLYNMPLVPHSYFFSEMLRSLVQGKTDAAAARLPQTGPHRRSRKRPWSHGGRAEHYIQNKQPSPPNQKCESTEMPPPNWTPKLPETIYDKPVMERPLELTMNKSPLNNTTKDESGLSSQSPHKTMPNFQLNNTEKLETNLPNGQIPMMFPNLPPQEPNASTSDMILPPPPPIWYPSLYPAPYGIDPLHFFIDLRVSGHIYDRKNPKDHNIPPHLNNPHIPGNNPLDSNSTMTSSSLLENLNNFNSLNRETLVKRHASAFTVPTPSALRNDPLNLSGNKYTTPQQKYSEKSSKFDIKSMGFDSENPNSTHYILKNLSTIYKSVHDGVEERGIDLTSPKVEEVKEEAIKDEGNDDNKDEEKEKKCKDLRALIGLELVVDYVKHEKPNKNQSEDSSVTDIESNISSPSVEVVTIPDVDNRI